MTLTLDNVASVYSGKRNTCCCGCAGKHTYASALRDEASKSRGYEVRDEEVNDRTVKMIFNKFMKNEFDKISDTCFSFETDTRLYVLYMKGH